MTSLGGELTFIQSIHSVNLPIIATPKSSHIIANMELLNIGGEVGH